MGKWLDLHTVALMAKYSISLEEVERTPNEQNQRVRALMGTCQTSQRTEK